MAIRDNLQDQKINKLSSEIENLKENNGETSGDAAGGIIAGIIRPTSDGWIVLNDEGHTPVNIASVEMDETNGYLVVNFSNEFENINTFVVTQDEAFALAGITCGASVTTTTAKIYLKQHINLGGYITLSNNALVTNAFQDGIKSAYVNDAGKLVVDFDERATLGSIIGASVIMHHDFPGYTAGCALGVNDEGNVNLVVTIYKASGEAITCPSNIKIFVNATINGIITKVSDDWLSVYNGNLWLYGLFT